MIDNETKKITVYDDNGKEVNINVIFTFDVRNFNKRYVVYTLNFDENKATNDVLISEIDINTNVIKEIDETEISTVLEYYEAVKKEIIE